MANPQPARSRSRAAAAPAPAPAPTAEQTDLPTDAPTPVAEIVEPEVVAPITGLTPEEEAELATVEIQVGMEIGCPEFEDGQFRTAKVIRVHDDKGGVDVLIDEIGWEWPIKLDRINVGQSEWDHVATDYPEPGALPKFDRAHRMSATDRDALDRAAEQEKQAQAKLAAELEAAKAEPPKAEPVKAEPVKAPVRDGVVAPRRPNGILATWKGPGSLMGPCVLPDGRSVGLVAAGTKGYFPARAVTSDRQRFDIHSA